MGSLRSKEGEARYRAAIARGALDNDCPLCCEEAVLKQFVHWRIIPNEYPYDRIAAVHHMLVPNRHTTEQKLSDAERSELAVLKETYLNEQYELLIEPTNVKKTIPEHFHLHLIVIKDFDE